VSLFIITSLFIFVVNNTDLLEFNIGPFDVIIETDEPGLEYFRVILSYRKSSGVQYRQTVTIPANTVRRFPKGTFGFMRSNPAINIEFYNPKYIIPGMKIRPRDLGNETINIKVKATPYLEELELLLNKYMEEYKKRTPQKSLEDLKAEREKQKIIFLSYHFMVLSRSYFACYILEI